MRKINKIIIHCSATPPGMDIGATEIRDWHINKNGWSDIGYHYVIRQSGDVEKGRPNDIAGAHVKGHNSDSLGVCLVGGVDESNRPDSNYTRNQWAALESVVDRLLVDYPNATVAGHRDYDAGKACPCFDVNEWWKV